MWHLFKYDKLTEFVRQNYQIFVTVLSNVVLGTIDEHAEVLLKTGFIDQSDEKYPHNVLHVYSENALTVFRN